MLLILTAVGYLITNVLAMFGLFSGSLPGFGEVLSSWAPVAFVATYVASTVVVMIDYRQRGGCTVCGSRRCCLGRCCTPACEQVMFLIAMGFAALLCSFGCGSFLGFIASSFANPNNAISDPMLAFMWFSAPVILSFVVIYRTTKKFVRELGAVDGVVPADDTAYIALVDAGDNK